MVWTGSDGFVFQSGFFVTPIVGDAKEQKMQTNCNAKDVKRSVPDSASS